MAELEINSCTRVAFSSHQHTDDAETFGGLNKKSRDFAYFAEGGKLVIKSTKDGATISGVNFPYRMPSVSITCFCESSLLGRPVLIAGLDCNGGGPAGMICLVNAANSVILKSIALDHVPTCIEEIKSDGGADAKPSLLCERLKLFFGVIAVGTVGGHVYLIDTTADVIQCDNKEQSVSTAWGLWRLDRTDLPVLYREDAINVDKVLTFDLSEPHCTQNTFQYSGPTGKVIGTYEYDDVAVTAMLFVENACLLVVALSLGCFQIWDLSFMTLIFSSQVVQNNCAITHLAFQEPEDDPRHCCYLWVARGPSNLESANAATMMMLYQLAFDAKENVEGLGHIYKDLSGVCLHFEHQLTSDVHHLADSSSIGSRVISLQAVEQGQFADAPLLFVAWEAPAQDPQLRPTCHLGVFDLNKWYHRQMPGSIRDAMYGSKDLWCQFFAFYSLTDVTEPFSYDSFLDLRVNPRSIVRFKHSTLSAPPEQYFWPSSLSFDCRGITKESVLDIEVLGVQTKVLSDLVKGHSDCFDIAVSFFNRAWIAGLMPTHLDISKTHDATFYCEALLSIALEYNTAGFIYQCVDIWSSSNVSNSVASLRLVFKWAWGRVMQIKSQLDELHVALFVEPLSVAAHSLPSTLKSALWQLEQLVAILSRLAGSGVAVTDAAKEELNVRLLVTECIFKYLTVLLNLVLCNILPDRAGLTVAGSTRCIRYDADELDETISVRKDNLAALNQSTKWPVSKLFMDYLTEDLEVCIEENMFEEETEWDGVYPPPSINAMCKSFLIDLPDSKSREKTYCYWLLDVLEDELTVEDELLVTGLRGCGLEECDVLLVKAMRLMDNGRCQEAVEMLVSNDLKLQPAECSLLARSLSMRGCGDLALFFLTIGMRSAAIISVDAEFYIHLLISRGRTMDAYNVKKSASVDKAPALLCAFFNSCLACNRAEELLDFPLLESELDHLFHLLTKSSTARSKDLLVALATYRRRHTVVGDLLRATSKPQGIDYHGNNSHTRTVILKTYLHLLPKLQRDLAMQPAAAFVKQQHAFKEVQRPQVLSALVRKASRSAPVSRSTILYAAMQSVDAANSVCQPAARRPSIPFMSPIVLSSSEHKMEYPQSKTVFASKKNEDSRQQKNRRRSGTAPKSSGSMLPPRDSLYSGAAALRLLKTPPSRKFLSNRFDDKGDEFSLQTPSSILKTAKKVVMLDTKKKVEERRKIRFEMSDSDDEEPVTASVDVLLPSVKTSNKQPGVSFIDAPSAADGSQSFYSNQSMASESNITMETHPMADTSVSFESDQSTASVVVMDASCDDHQHAASFSAVDVLSESIPLCVCDDDDVNAGDTSLDSRHGVSFGLPAPEVPLFPGSAIATQELTSSHDPSSSVEQPLSLALPSSFAMSSSLDQLPEMFDNQTSSPPTTVEEQEDVSGTLSSVKKRPRMQSRLQTVLEPASTHLLRSATRRSQRSGSTVASQSPISFVRDDLSKEKEPKSTPVSTTPTRQPRRAKPVGQSPSSSSAARRMAASPRVHTMNLRSRVTK